MTKLDYDWNSVAELHQSPAPGDLHGNYEPIADEEISGPLGLLVQYIAAQPDDWRPYLSLSVDGAILESDEIIQLAASDSFRAWQAKRAA